VAAPGNTTPLPGIPVPPGSAAPAAPGTGAQPEEPPDPLELARGFYERSLEHFVERLRIDWRDEDTAANVELIQRRLRELDEIEQQREEQEQQQEQEQEGEEPQENEEQDSDEQEESEQGEPSEQDPNEQQEPQDGEPEDPSEEEQQEPEPQDGEGEESAPPQDPPPGEPEERVLTREEVMRLLDQLEQIEQEAEKIQERLRDRNRVPVKRDW
jgi:Ca-activated chloride channel family protein